MRSKLNIVDLAGSEKWGEGTEPGSQRAAEMITINRSLSTLGKCVYALVQGWGHVPYRDSTLTRLLQDSLGGTSLLTFVTTVSPSDLSAEESLATLRFADRAR
ncbi:kinesin-like protein, partial [Kipferlia bialata]|eukprot:g11555.t1